LVVLPDPDVEAGGIPMTTVNSGATIRAERTEDEVLLRLPNPNRLLRALLPEEAVKHLMAAQREQLLFMRAMIDAAITRVETAEREGANLGPRRTEITVE
jgi:hypothetical protein